MHDPNGPNCYETIHENEIIHDNGVFRLKLTFNKANIYVDVKAGTKMNMIKSMIFKA